MLHSPVTGVQRYLLEILHRIGQHTDTLAPKSWTSGIKGHAWEQCVLPAVVRGRVLFSPSNTGPLAVSRQVVTLHDVVPLDHPEWLSPKFAAWYRFLTPRLMRRAARIITVSEFSKRRLLDQVRLDESKIRVIPNGVDARFHPRDKGQIDHTLRSLGLPSRRYVLSVGSLEPRKNLGRLLQAWSMVHQTLPEDLWLVISGQGNPKVFAAGLGIDKMPPRVHLTGHVPDEILPFLYAGADLFAYLSLYEGFGLPPLEAMASGVPVITSDRTSLPEVTGDAALTVDPWDVEAIAAAIKTLSGNAELRADLISKGLARARQFSWDLTAERTRAVLREVADA